MNDGRGTTRQCIETTLDDAGSELTEADKQFFLGLYRCAVSEYQPMIEKRTGVQLGSILVRDFRQHDHDLMQCLERWKRSWTSRLFRRSSIKAHLKRWRDYLDATYIRRSRACNAAYHRNAIYVSFAHGVASHEFGFAFTVVHELSHALWERLAGRSLFPRPNLVESEHKKYKVIVEGFATYAERIWFADMYPQQVRKYANSLRAKPDGIYREGLRRVEELVHENGEQILMEIPKRWREL